MERGTNNHAEILQWISEDWLNNSNIYSSSVCFVQGFPGVGKTHLARAFNNKIKRKDSLDSIWLDIPIPDSKIDPVYSLLSDLSSHLKAKDRNNLATALKKNQRADIALLKDLSKPIVIIIDDVQYSFTERGNRPLAKLEEILNAIARDTGHSGKILLLSNRVVEDEVLEHFDSYTLLPLKPENAKQLLSGQLANRKVREEFPEEIQDKFVEWLGYNPRAIITLASALRYSSIEELIEIKTEVWKSRDHKIKDEDLLEKLEARLLEKIFASLTSETNTFLQQLAVYRKPFGEESMKAIPSEGKSHTKKKKELINRFLLERHSHNIKQFALHPIARETALQHLKENEKALKQAHILASDYYNRFKGQIITGKPEKLGSYFIETCYHLYQGQQQERLGKIAAKYAEYRISSSKKRSNHKSSVNKEQLNQQINVLSAISEFINFDDERIEIQLAQALIERKEEGDIENALIHARRATSFGVLYRTWKLRVDLELKINGIHEAIKAAQEGLNKISRESNHSSLYNYYFKLLAQENIDKAITLLEQDINLNPRNGNLYLHCGKLLAEENINEAIALVKQGIDLNPRNGELYKYCANLLAEENIDEAIALVKQGIDLNPTNINLYLHCGKLSEKVNKQNTIALLKRGIELNLSNQHSASLYIQCVKLLEEENRKEAIIILQQGIEVNHNNQNNISLYIHCARLLTQENKKDAINLLRKGIKEFPNSSKLYENCARLLVIEDKQEDAIALLCQGIIKIPNNYNLYKYCVQLLSKENKKDAIDLLEQGIGNNPNDSSFYLYYAQLFLTEDKEKAISVLEEANQKIPNNPDLYRKLSWLLFKENKLAEACKILNEAMSVNQKNETLVNHAAQKVMSYYFVLQDSETLNDFLNNTTSLNQQSLIYGRVLQLELQQQWKKAAEVAHEINLLYPNSELLRQEAFSWFCVGEIKLASEILENINIKEESISGWLKAFVALKNGEQKLAEECIAAYLNRPLADNEEVNENFLLYLWDISVDLDKGINVAFVFPTLPPSITGFDVPITRSQHGHRVLLNILKQESQSDLPNSEIYQFTSEGKIDNKISNVINNPITDVISSEYDVISQTKNITEIRDEIMPRLQTKIYSTLNQDDVINLESSLTEIFIKINSTEARKNLLSNAGVDPYFINNLYFNLSTSEFITNLIAQFKEYKVSSRKPNYHPLISFIDYLIKEPEKYNLDDRDFEIFDQIITFGKIKIQELLTGNVEIKTNLNISKIGNSEPTIGIITALEKEYAAVQAVFEDGRNEKKSGTGAGRRYWLTEIGDSEGNPQTVAVTLADMGNNIAAIRATNMLSHYPSIRSIIMCGIAGGVPHPTKGEDHVRLGDIVISNKKGIVQYDFDKESQQFTEIRAMPVAASAELVEAARYLRVNEMSGQRPWEDVILKALQKLQWQRPSQETDLLHSSVQTDETICHPEDPERRENQPRIFLGAIGSANKLLKNPQKRDLLGEQYGVKAIEMEGSGVADATWSCEKGYLVVRGICDYCDEHKSDTWQQYAAVTAAAYVRTLLSSI